MKKIASLIAGISLLAATLAPVTVSAASAPMSLAGTTQTNGTFSTIVYENSDGPVSSVYLAMDFSTAVSNVAYDYSVGPFTTTDPSGGHLSQGSVNGLQPIARVSFTLANPGTVTATVNTNASYVKGASGTTVVRYTLNAASANFTYTAPAPAQGGMGGGNNDTTTTTTSGRSNTVAQNTGNAAPAPAATTPATDDKAKAEVKDAETKAKDGTKDKEMVQNAADNKNNPWPWIILIAVATAAIAYALRNRTAGVKATETAKVKEVKPTLADAPKAAAPIAAAAGAKKAASNAANKKKRQGGKRPR